MLEYFKTILAKVSFDRRLFEKELRKAIKSLVSDEIPKLRDWCYDEFSHIYGTILNKCFTNVLT